MAAKLSPRVVAGGVGLYVATALGAYAYLRSKGDGSTCEHGAAAAAGGGSAFDCLANSYDKRINMDETVMGVKLLRRWLVREAQGDVLEVSAGTGRNLPYYRLDQLRSLTLTDISPNMLAAAHEKHREMHQKRRAGADGQQPPSVRFLLADAQHMCSSGSSGDGDSSSSGDDDSASSSRPARHQQQQQQQPGFDRPQLERPHTFPPHSFDCVVDTFGLCSHEDPVQVLKEMARVCKPGGKLLLLEHGRGTWGWVNGVLDRAAEEHHAKWGCWWNREIEGLAAAAGLRVESQSRWHFGSTYLVVARPPLVEPL